MRNLKENKSFAERFKEYSDDALTDMIINLRRKYEDGPTLQSLVKDIEDELKRRKQSKNMKLNEFKSLVREAVKKKLAENQPAPSRENPDRETIERGTEEEKEKKRRRIGNPNVDPKPKATMNENEKEVLKQIVDRFKQSKRK